MGEGWLSRFRTRKRLSQKKGRSRPFRHRFRGLRGVEQLEQRLPLASFYVATDGDNGDPGSVAQPFETIEHGISLLQPGDTLYIRGGSYQEEITIDGLDGTAGAPITITNYQDEVVTLDGTIPITDSWVQHSDNIYKTTVSEHVWQLFVDGTMQVTARWPNVPVGHPTAPFAAQANGIDPQPGTWWDQDTTWALGAHPHNNNGIITVDPSRQDIYGNPLDLAALGVSFEGGSLMLNHHSELTFEREILNHVAGSNTFVHDPLINPHDQREPYFYIEHLNALDLPGEWYYLPNDPDDLSVAGGTVYLIPDDGLDPTGRTIRGKTQSFFFDIDNSDYVTISGLNFFGTTLQSENGSHITVEDSHFTYPSFFARVLGEYGIFHGGVASERHGKVTKLTGPNGGSFNTFRNNVVEYTEGMALNMFKGGGDVVENNLFHHIDFSGVGQIGVDTRKDDSLIITRNTFHTGGGSAVFKHGSGEISFNEVYQFGYLQQDGAAFTINSADTSGTVREFNWVHHTSKFGMRWDGNTGMNGSNHHNVGFAVNGMMQVKGDDHDTHNNTILDSGHRNAIIILAEGGTQNNNSRTKNNLADRIAGHRSQSVSLYPIPGDHTNNWNGYITLEDVRTQLRDPDNYDFRPKEDAAVVDAGVQLPGFTDDFLGTAPDIGAYEFGDTNYWIPGRIFTHASHPIVPDGTVNVKVGSDLMWLGGMDALSHDIYLGATAVLTGADFQGNQTNNIFTPDVLPPNQQFFWRIDTVTAAGTITGDTWSFTTASSTADFDLDGDVDGADFLKWQRGFGTQSGVTQMDGDATGDEAVDGGDLAVWEGHYSSATVPLSTLAVGDVAIAVQAKTATPMETDIQIVTGIYNDSLLASGNRSEESTSVIDLAITELSTGGDLDQNIIAPHDLPTDGLATSQASIETTEQELGTPFEALDSAFADTWDSLSRWQL